MLEMMGRRCRHAHRQSVRGRVEHSREAQLLLWSRDCIVVLLTLALGYIHIYCMYLSYICMRLYLIRCLYIFLHIYLYIYNI